MSDQPAPPFPPFNPNASAPPPAAPPETPAPKRRKSGKKAAAAAQAPAEPAVPRQRRRKSGAPKGKRAPKFDLQTILAAASSLKESDMDAFQKMIGICQDLGKPARDRVLEAIGKIFS